MKLVFVLSMPGIASWNGRWSGEGKLYAIVKSFTSKKEQERARKVAVGAPYRYRWTDGWAARIEVHEVDAREARKLAKESDGFCGYDWMVESLLRYGDIYADHERPMETGVLPPRGKVGGQDLLGDLPQEGDVETGAAGTAPEDTEAKPVESAPPTRQLGEYNQRRDRDERHGNELLKACTGSSDDSELVKLLRDRRRAPWQSYGRRGSWLRWHGHRADQIEYSAWVVGGIVVLAVLGAAGIVVGEAVAWLEIWLRGGGF